MEKVIDCFDGDYAFLSNFYEHPIEMNGVTYKTAEHAFQAMKATTKADHDLIVNADTPGRAKRLGKKIQLRSDWEDIKYIIMQDILRVKFASPELGQMLLATGDATLIEGNDWHDNLWGNCTCPKCADKVGKNWLGNILMGVRQDLIQLSP